MGISLPDIAIERLKHMNDKKNANTLQDIFRRIYSPEAQREEVEAIKKHLKDPENKKRLRSFMSQMEEVRQGKRTEADFNGRVIKKIVFR